MNERPLSPEDAWGRKQRIQCLQAAARLAVAHGNSRNDIDAAHWARAYRLETEDVGAAFDMAMSKKSLQPVQYEEFPGK